MNCAGSNREWTAACEGECNWRTRPLTNFKIFLSKRSFTTRRTRRKRPGGALGTLIELITFYTLKSWGLEHNTAIERPLPEFANPEIAHNVEYSLHAARLVESTEFSRDSLPMTASKILHHCAIDPKLRARKTNVLLGKLLTLRNACTVCDLGDEFLNAYLDELSGDKGRLTVVSLRRHPFAIFECKRVGIEEGNKKGPQTIEKAKQGGVRRQDGLFVAEDPILGRQNGRPYPGKRRLFHL